MTEQQWLKSIGVFNLTLFAASHEGGARRKTGRRKLRLFGCFSCRQLWEQLTDERSRRAVEVAERLADDQATPKEVNRAATAAIEAWRAADLRTYDGEYRRAVEARGWLLEDERIAAQAAACVLNNLWKSFSCRGMFYQGPDTTGLAQTIYPARRRVQADAVRCIFGNPYRPVVVEPHWLAWNDGTLKQLARSIYDDRSWDNLPILADALEDAGCTREDILAHCRGPGPHTRGCHVVDLLLAKE